MSKFAFSKEEDENLIQEVIKYKVLYDPQHKYFKRSLYKDTLWKKISQEVNREGSFYKS